MNYLLRGVVTFVAKDTVNIRFDGDQHVSPYPKEGFGQFVKRRQLKAVTNTYYGTLLIEEWNLNVITRNGWMEGDLLDFAMSRYYMDNTKSSISASVYLLKASGNLEVRVSGLLLCLSATFVLTPLFFADCFGCSHRHQGAQGAPLPAAVRAALVAPCACCGGPLALRRGFGERQDLRALGHAVRFVHWRT